MQIFHGINVVSLSVSNLPKAKRFYSDVLGFGKPVYDMPEIKWIEWSSGNAANFSVMQNDEKVPPSHHTTIVFNVDDCHAAVAELRKRCVQCDDPVVVPSVITFASFYDPNGNRLQMCSAPPSA